MERRYEEKLIDPEYAHFLLATQPEGWNRRVSPKRVRSYATDMIRGDWDGLNGETLKVDIDGQLVDGQHRLLAVIEAGVTTPMTIVYGVHDAARYTIDAGRPRSIANLIEMEGIGAMRSTDVASIARLIYRYATATNSRLTREQHGKMLQAETRQLLLRIAGKYEEQINYSLSFIGYAKDIRVLFCGTIGAFTHFMASRSNSLLADEFFEQLKTGANLSEDAPAFLVRRNLLRRAVNAKGMKEREITAAIIAKGWLLFENSETTAKQIRWTPAEPFPAFRVGISIDDL